MDNYNLKIKIFIFFLFLFFALSSQSSWAQCNDGTCDITLTASSSGIFTINNERMCITGGIFTGEISLNGNSELCISAGVDFQPASIMMSEDAVINNYGIWTDNVPTLDGTVNNFGTINTTNVIVRNSFINKGNAEGNVEINTGASLSNEGLWRANDVIVLGEFLNLGELQISRVGLADGLLSIEAGGVFSHLPGGVLNTFQLNNEGATTLEGASNQISDRMENQNGAQLKVAGVLVTVGSGFRNFGEVTGGNSVDACARINCLFFVNSGAGASVGLDGSHIGICPTGTSNIDDPAKIGANVTECAGCTPLPITLTFFVGSLNTDPPGSILLEWETLNETDNEFFTIQRSADAQNFQDIAFMAGQGTSVVPQFYQFLDEQPLPRINYYRLKQTDFDGSFSFSPIIAVDPDLDLKKKPFVLIHTADVPQMVKVEFLGNPSTLEDLNFVLINPLGGEVWRAKNSLPELNNQLNLQWNYLAKGMYLLQIDNLQFSSSFKLVKK